MSTTASSMMPPASARDGSSLEASNNNAHALISLKKKKGFMDRFVKPKSDEEKNPGNVISDPMQYNKWSKESLLNSSKAILDRKVDPSKRVPTEKTLISNAPRSSRFGSRDAGSGRASAAYSSSGHGSGETTNKDTKAKATVNLSNSNYFKSRFQSDDVDSPLDKVSKLIPFSSVAKERSRSEKTASVLKLAPLNDSDDDLPASSFLLKSSVAAKKLHSTTTASTSSIHSKLPSQSRNRPTVSSGRPNLRDDISSPDVFETKRRSPKMMKYIDSDESDNDNALQDSKSILNVAPRGVSKKKASPFDKKRKNNQSLVPGNVPKKKTLEFGQKLPKVEAVPNDVNAVFENDQDSEDWTLKWCGLDVRPGDSVLATWGSTGLYSPCQIQNYDPTSRLFKLTAPASNPQPVAVPRGSFFCRSDKGFLSCNLNLEAVSDFLASKSTKGLPPRVLKQLPATLELLEDILTGKRKSVFMDAWKSGDASRLQSLSYGAKTSGVLSSDAEEALFEETLRNAVEYPPDCLGDDLDVSLRRDRLLCSVLVPEALIEMKKNFSDMKRRDVAADESAWVSSMLTLRESLTLGQKMRGI
ncbi:hypothetical protein BJ741DRAFT_82542 [Chytriomyces cf. hyalinus JEL632]|nr:hypothetical protein BJ741DRAFT_82542 [Chytriomyces cf. hyalinus JEL632]